MFSDKTKNNSLSSKKDGAIFLFISSDLRKK